MQSIRTGIGYDVHKLVPGSEIILLVIGRIIGDVHLTIFACNRAIFLASFLSRHILMEMYYATA